MKKSTFPDHLCSKHQSLFAVSWSQVQILACHLLDECPWTSQFILPKAQFPHLRNGNGHNCSESLWELRDVTGKIPLNLTFSICTMEIISTTQDCCEMVYMKIPGTKLQLHKSPRFWFLRPHPFLTNTSPYKISIICCVPQQNEWLFSNARERLYLCIVET